MGDARQSVLGCCASPCLLAWCEVRLPLRSSLEVVDVLER